jgi:hypothetical protein
MAALRRANERQINRENFFVELVQRAFMDVAATRVVTCEIALARSRP